MVEGQEIDDLTTCDKISFNFFLADVGATWNLTRKTSEEHRGVIYQTNQKRAL